MVALHDYSLFLLQKSLPWWLWLLLFLIVVALVVWALTRSSASLKSAAIPFLSEEHAEGSKHNDGLQFDSGKTVDDLQNESVSTLVENELEPIQADDGPIPGLGEAPGIKSPISGFQPDDLTIIEGIGPKIKLVLAGAGITRFEQLAECDVDQLAVIMKNAGLRIANPKTWPSQARLAAAGEWDKLQSYQERLNAGRE